MSPDELRRPRVLLVGLGPTTESALDGLIGDFDVVGLIRNTEDRTVARARQAGVPVLLEPTIAGLRSALEEFSPDAVVVSSFNRIIGPEMLDRCPFINVHFAPLPRGRGRATVNWAIINGDDRAWISIHHLVAELDAGGLLYQGFAPIESTSTVSSLYEDLNRLQRDHLAEAVRGALAGDPGATQDERQASYYCTRIPTDGEVDWSLTAVEIDRLVRALQPPFPYAFTWLGLERLHIVRVEVLNEADRFEGRILGRVVAVDRTRGSVDVLAGAGTIRLHELALDDGVAAPAATLVQSSRSTLGLSTMDLVGELIRLRSLIETGASDSV